MLAATNSAPLSRPSPALQWRHLQFPAQAGHLNSCAAQDNNQNTALQTLQNFLCEDARCTENGQTDVYVGSRNGIFQSIVPWHAQTVSLPIRLGEKVLWAPQLQAIRLTPLAQQGVLAADDGIALLKWLRQTQPDRSVVLTDVATDTPLYAAALRAAVAGFVLTKNSPDAHLFHRFTGTYLDFFNSRSSKYKNQLRKKEKVFTERFGSRWRLEEYSQADAAEAFLGVAAAINRKTYQYRLFGESVDAEADSVAAARRSAQAGCFRSFVLWGEDQPVCFVLGHQRADGTYEHRQTGYDPAFRDCAPGIFCNIQLLQRLYTRNRPTLLDFGSGDSDYKRLFSNESRTTANPILVPDLVRYRVLVWLFDASARFNMAVAGALQRWGVKDWIKRRLRGAR